MISAADFSAVFSTSTRQKQQAFRDRRKPQAAPADCLSRWEDDGGLPAAIMASRKTKNHNQSG